MWYFLESKHGTHSTVLTIALVLHNFMETTIFLAHKHLIFNTPYLKSCIKFDTILNVDVSILKQRPVSVSIYSFKVSDVSKHFNSDGPFRFDIKCSGE